MLATLASVWMRLGKYQMVSVRDGLGCNFFLLLSVVRPAA